MSYSRAKRIKTESSRPLRKYFPSDSDNPSNRQTPQPSISSNGRTSVLSRVLKEINHEVNYQLLTIDQIVEERNMLSKKVKEMNGKMARMVEKQMERRSEYAQVNRKSIMTREMGMSYEQLNKEYIENANKIEQMQDEFKQSNDRLRLLSDPNSKMNLIQKIAQCQLKVKEIKEQLSRIKKNKSIRERQIIKGVKIDKGGQIQNLQVEYINYTRKSQQLMSRSEQIQTEMTDAELKVMKQKDYFDELKTEITKYEDKEEMTPTMKEHYNLLYKSHKKKLELYMKRNEREEESMKRKYYNLLLDFKDSKARLANVEHTIALRQKDNEKAYDFIKGLTEKLKQIQDHPGQGFKRSQTDFMLTEIPKEKVFIKRRVNTEAVQFPDTPKEKIAINSPKQSRIRRWNIRNIGSITKQASVSNKELTYSFSGNSLSESQNRNNHHSLNKNPREPGSVKHFYTQGDDAVKGSPQLSQVTSDIEESYPSDFEG